MPWWVIAYLAIFSFFVLANIFYWLSIRGKWWIIVYDIATGTYLMGMMVAYWLPEVSSALNAIHIPIFAVVLFSEFYLTVFADYEELGLKLSEEFSERDLDLAKALSVIFMSPAYITGTLLCAELLQAGS